MPEVKNLQYVSLESLALGAAGEVFDRALGQVLENIQDPNTDPRAKRQVTLTVTITPHDGRETAGYLAGAVAKLAPIRPHASIMHLGRVDGRAVAATADTRQGSLFETEQDPSVRPLTPQTATAS